MLSKFLGFVTRPPVPFVLGTLLAVLLLWSGGHLFQSGYGWPSTATISICCVLVVVLAVTVMVLRSVRARQKARAIEKEIHNQAKAQAATMPPGHQGEVQELQKRFDEALDSLKSSKLGRGALYAMPWFIIIGPPGSGKTTAITESGLNFPFMKGPNQKRGIRGLGGTRNCDWWFTDQSILLDTAGRYTTQAEDHEEWLAFLGMIKKARKNKPINGVLLAISITDVLDADDEGIERHATTIRQRIDELVKQLEVVFPVYLMFTKCDLLDGFVEFFSAMSKEERAQVWGMTFDKQAGAGAEMHERFSDEFGLLCNRIDEERMRLLVPDRPSGQQQKIFSLSLQLRATRRKLTEFVRLLTQPNPYSDASELRGVYLTSGTQEGAPIDLVLKKLSSAFGLAASKDAGSAGAVEAKSYFIRDLFTKVIYADRELAHSSASVQRRRELARKAVIYGSAAACVALSVGAVMSFAGTRSLLGNVTQARLAPDAIAASRTGAPNEEAQKRLNVLRDHCMVLLDAYSPSSLLGPSRADLMTAMGDYAQGVHATFLIPANRFVEKQLKEYVADTNKLEFAAISQLVAVYGAMDGEVVPLDKILSTALEEQNLWRWSPEEIGRTKVTVANSEESRHLAAFVRARRFDTTAWLVGSDKALLGSARQKVDSAPQKQSVIKEVLKQDTAIKEASEADLPDLVIKKMEEKSGTKIEKTAALVQEISTQRKTDVLRSTANIALQDTSSLGKVIESLADLTRPQSAPLRTFTENLETLRLAGAVPRPGLGKDGVVDTYAEALTEVANLRVTIELMARSGTPGRYVLPDVIANKSDTMQQFGKEWNATQASIARKVVQIADLMKAQGEQPSTPAVDAISSSLNGIMRSLLEAIAREARSEMQQHWDSTVGADIATYAERFPSRADAAEEIGVPGFVDLFRPGGKLDQELAIIARLRAIKDLQPFLGLDHPFEDMVTRIRAIQAAGFDPAAPQAARLQFRIAKMDFDDPVQNVIFTIAQGDEVNRNQSGTDVKIRNLVRNWPIGKVGTQVLLETSVQLPNNQTLKLSIPESGTSPSPWGLLRVLSMGNLEKVGNDAKVTFERDFDRKDGSPKTRLVCWIQFEQEGAQNALLPRFFLLTPPTHVFQVR